MKAVVDELVHQMFKRLNKRLRRGEQVPVADIRAAISRPMFWVEFDPKPPE